jgi:hypothetical protein
MFTIVNSLVNKAVYRRLQPKKQKTGIFVNSLFLQDLCLSSMEMVMRSMALGWGGSKERLSLSIFPSFITLDSRRSCANKIIA